MSNILREHMADAILEGVDAVHDMDVTHDQYAWSAADAVIAALRDMVVPLDWKGSHFAYCTLPFCQYQAREAEDGFYIQADGYCSQVVASQLPTLEDAKQAAQDHYRAQILAALGITRETAE